MNKKSGRTLSREEAPAYAPGHGGMKCPCCTMGPPSEHKKRLTRAARRKAKQTAVKQELDEWLQDMQDDADELAEMERYDDWNL